MEAKKSQYRPSSKAGNGLDRAYGLCDRLLGEVRAARAIHSRVCERQPEHVGAILEGIFKKIKFKDPKKFKRVRS